jgi:hypothetical protein
VSQLPLVDVPATPVLTGRQESAWTYLKTRAGGCTTVELGAYLHALKGRHPDGEPCLYCASEALSVLRSRALKPLVIHRRTRGVWEPRDRADRTDGRGAQTDELPDWLA